MKSWILRAGLALLCMAIALNTHAQQPPKNTRTGEAVAVVRNDNTAAMTFSYHSGDTWKEATLQPGKDMSVTADKIRVATTRADKAIITVEYPVEAGKKYRIVWNSQMWDFAPIRGE
jgi:hypothetical protein